MRYGVFLYNVFHQSFPELLFSLESCVVVYLSLLMTYSSLFFRHTVRTKILNISQFEKKNPHCLPFLLLRVIIKLLQIHVLKAKLNITLTSSARKKKLNCVLKQNKIMLFTIIFQGIIYRIPTTCLYFRFKIHPLSRISIRIAWPMPEVQHATYPTLSNAKRSA